MKTAVILIGHGSRLKGFERPMKKALLELKKRGAADIILAAYLEINFPNIEQAILSAVKKGAQLIKVLPYFLLIGNHVKKDIPLLVKEARKKCPKKVKVRLCPYLGYDAKIADILLKRLGSTR